MSKQSKDQQKLGKFYTFEVTAEKLQTVQQKARSMYFKHFRNAFIFGFCIEFMIIKSRICKFHLFIYIKMKILLEKVHKEDQNQKKKKMIIQIQPIIIHYINETQLSFNKLTFLLNYLIIILIQYYHLSKLKRNRIVIMDNLQQILVHQILKPLHNLTNLNQFLQKTNNQLYLCFLQFSFNSFLILHINYFSLPQESYVQNIILKIYILFKIIILDILTIYI
ncbi:unnamed protein product (macronuclear) [Paramecium tetraurelia]|uniref:Transmembrane protein n=1 Tax=Paramecium tetraurelia TaxID=5888 RepID=A0BLM6_PARTE|nr:uncharacterized protein GSPATT00030076001 [Paramecium tetraurelia]CAK59443.1 unnamed protein product [Paramecium tetraurelia]|eukprot:XP_001426841.1 hypothetical protein (macronuclear) [Paramecium tetraurelia strain d4-2]